MKILKFIPAVYVAALAVTVSLRADILFSDNFNAASGFTTDINLKLSIRQTGTLAPQKWTAYDVSDVSSGSASLGNPKDSPLSKGPAEDYLFFNKKEQVSLTGLALSSNNVKGPILISFDMFPGTSGNEDQWTSFSLTPTINPGFDVNHSGFPIQNTPGAFGFLQKGNGEISIWYGVAMSGGASQDNSTPQPQPAASGTATGSQYSLLLTDTAGTGSAFAGNGTRIKFMNSGNTIGTYDLAVGMSTVYLSFGSTDLQAGGIDNVLIQTVPNPSK